MQEHATPRISEMVVEKQTVRETKLEALETSFTRFSVDVDERQHDVTIGLREAKTSYNTHRRE